MDTLQSSSREESIDWYFSIVVKNNVSELETNSTEESILAFQEE